jgi:hypothetical protein
MNKDFSCEPLSFWALSIIQLLKTHILNKAFRGMAQWLRIAPSETNWLGAWTRFYLRIETDPVSETSLSIFVLNSRRWTKSKCWEMLNVIVHCQNTVQLKVFSAKITKPTPHYMTEVSKGECKYLSDGMSVTKYTSFISVLHLFSFSRSWIILDHTQLKMPRNVTTFT